MVATELLKRALYTLQVAATLHVSLSDEAHKDFIQDISRLERHIFPNQRNLELMVLKGRLNANCQQVPLQNIQQIVYKWKRDNQEMMRTS